MTEQSKTEILNHVEAILDEANEENIVINNTTIYENVNPIIKLYGKIAFTIKEVAEMFGVAEKTIKKMVDNGDLKAMYMNQNARIYYSEIDRFGKEFSGNMKYKN